MATRVFESAIIASNTDAVWALIKPLDFHFLPSVKTVELEDKNSTPATVGTVRKVTYIDGTAQRVKLLELSDAQRFVTWELIESVPPISYSGVIHTIQLRRVTEDAHTFIEFWSDFSKDVKNEVIQDSKFKKLEFFKAVASVTESRCNQFLKEIDFSTFTKLTGPQLEAAWTAFDTDKNGTLEPKELEKLVESVLTALAVEQHAVHKQLRSMFDEGYKRSAHHHHKGKGHDGKDVKAAPAPAAPKKDGAHLSKHVLEHLKKKVKPVTRQLMGRLDKNKDGKIDKSEFTVLFPSWFEKIVTDSIRESFF